MWNEAFTGHQGFETAQDSSFLMTLSSQVVSELQSIAEDPEDELEEFDSTNRVFIGSNVLAQIWKDNDKIILPSWIGHLPPCIGSSQHGKLSADQYRTVCSINLVTTLIRVWGSAQEGSKWKAKLAHMWTLTSKHISKYHQIMLRYLCMMQQLYPHAEIKPSHHLSLHLTQLMRQFGPVHAWRCFPFERYNGILQNIPTNYKLDISMNKYAAPYSFMFPIFFFLKCRRARRHHI